jgi:hypothetical protein
MLLSAMVAVVTALSASPAVAQVLPGGLTGLLRESLGTVQQEVLEAGDLVEEEVLEAGDLVEGETQEAADLAEEEIREAGDLIIDLLVGSPEPAPET